MYFAQECLDMLPVPSLEVYNARGVYPLLLSVLSREQMLQNVLQVLLFLFLLL